MAYKNRKKRNYEEEISSLKHKIQELERKQINMKDKLKFAILDKMPFTVWACDRNYKIVIWNKVCEKVYGCSVREAIGKDYANLFVDSVEEEQSRLDCIDIIENDLVCDNLLAYDHSSKDERRTMLTNCFRIWDEERNDYLQAEVGLEISDLSLKEDQHHTLREMGQARLAQQEDIIKMRKREIQSNLDVYYVKNILAIDGEKHDQKEYINSLLSQKGNREKVKTIEIEGEKKIKERRIELEKIKNEIREKVMNATKMEELSVAESEIPEI